MARIRTIKPEFPQSESMGRISRDARLLFIMLWTICDDYGKARGNSRALASLLFPYDVDAGERIDTWLGELEREGCILRYETDGNTYVMVRKWKDHQRVDKPTPSRIPDPRDDVGNPRENSRAFANPPVGTKEGKGKEGKGEGPEEGADALALDRKGQPYAFAGKIIRLTSTDFAAWQKAYPYLDLVEALQSRDRWLAEQGDDEDRKNWFHSTSSHLRRRNEARQQAASRRGPPLKVGEGLGAARRRPANIEVA